MAGRKRKDVTLEDIDRWIRQGYGSGKRESYKPWLRIQDVPSKGLSRLVPGTTVNRGHHLLSKLEFRHFLFFDFSRRYSDIQEQYPLFPLAKTQSISDKLKIRHPVYRGRWATPVVLTTDFLLTPHTLNGGVAPLPVESKYKSEFAQSKKLRRTLEKLELKRRYWKEVHGLDLLIATEDLVPDDLFYNLRVLNQVASPKAPLRANADRASFLDALATTPWRDVPLGTLLSAVGKKTGYTGREALELFKHFAWHHWVEIDLHTKLDLRAALTHLQVATGAAARERFCARVAA